MKTDDLIGLLAADALPPPPLRTGRIAGFALAAVVAVTGLFLAVAGARDGLAAAFARPEVAAKTVLPLILALLALRMALADLRPGARRPGWRWLMLPLSLAVALWVWAYAALPPALRFADVTQFALEECLGLIVSLSILPLILFLALMRQGASLAPARTGALAGLTTGCATAVGYSLFCTQDNPLFYVTWYGVAVLIVSALGAIAGWRFLRW